MNARPAPPAAANRQAETWRYRHEASRGREWTGLELAAADGTAACAWAPRSDALQKALDEAIRAADLETDEPGAPPPAALEWTRARRIARGLIATARLELRARQHEVPLHLWLGGAVRPSVRVTVPLAFRAVDRGGRDAELTRARARAEGARAVGVSSFAVHDTATDTDVIAETVSTVREIVGADASVLLRLTGQLDAAPARELLSRVRSSDLIAVVDPCASVVTCVEATSDELPALGLSAGRYARPALLQCLATAPPVLLLIDPLIEGGPAAVRELASVARVLQTDVSLTAEDGGAWLFRLCTELAAVLPACHLPIEAPLEWTTDSLHDMGVSDGAVCPTARPSSLEP